MKVKIEEFSVSTKGRGDIVDLTRVVEQVVSSSGIKNGIVNIFSPGSTVGLTTMEYEPGLKKDMDIFFDKLAPREVYYYHNETWGDDNGSSHILSSLFKPFFFFPVIDGKVIRGTWQQVVLLEFDIRSRDRKVIIQVLGE
ncbi:MAG: secondary thiamine-phosphate synthase enzyme YjbQ [Brevinematia bacterium]